MHYQKQKQKQNQILNYKFFFSHSARFPISDQCVRTALPVCRRLVVEALLCAASLHWTTYKYNRT